MTGYWKGKKIPYYPRPNRKINGELNPKWRGGRRIDKDGYILIHSPEHPYCDGDGYVREHRLVMEKDLGRFLSLTEVVHHKNGKKSDNRIENLESLENSSQHQKVGWKGGQYNSLIKYPNFICNCGSNKHYGKGLCKKCYSKEYLKSGYGKKYYDTNKEKMRKYAREYYQKYYSKKS